jgi:type II secretory pathway pseudopilin PulG
MQQHPQRSVRGVSLIEALLALVVMAMGMLAVAGVQATLRGNADLSRQRAEGLRLAQEAIEQARSFTALEGGAQNYVDLLTNGPSDVTPAGSNTQFSRTVQVTEIPSPGLKTLSVTVEWSDRAGSEPKPRVQLFTTIAKVSPEVAASLSVPSEGRPYRQPSARHRAIPPGAITQVDGTSTYAPPQAGGGPAATLTFNNGTGLVTRICVANDCDLGTWSTLSGYVRSLQGDPSGLGLAAVNNPAGAASAFFDATLPSPLDLEFQSLTEDAVVTGSRCFIQPPTGTENALEYLCVVPVKQLDNFIWSGRLRFKPDLLLASAPDSNLAKALRLCRYKPAPSPNGDYVNIKQPLTLQNYLAIRAGSGVGAPFVCPEPTVLHQPI